MISTLYIVWNDDNNLGIPIIDEQHRAIVSIINSIHHFIRIGHGEEAINPVLAMLDQYTNIHFKTEEFLLSEAGYPAIGEHVALHKTLIERIRQLAFAEKSEKDPEALLAFLKQWWLGHINSEDRKYVPFLLKAHV